MSPLRTAAAVLLLCACGRGERPAPAGTTPPAAQDDVAVCLAGETFVADGAITVSGDGGGGDAVEVSDLRWDRHEGCERVVIDLNAETGPASDAGSVRAEVLREYGVVRITLPRIDRAAQDATDAAFDGTLASGAYVVRSADGQFVFVDIHLAAAAEAHVSQLREPARVVVDLRPGGPALAGQPVMATRVVVLEPRGGAATWPLRVSGYARTFEANVVARVEHNGRDTAEQFTTATSWLEAWGWFSLVIDDGPDGPVVLHVGEYSARDGSWEGARIDLQLRR
jgi:hypothetical protein